MKRLVKSIGIEAALNASGLSYALNAKDFKVAPTIEVLNASGLSYQLKINQFNNYNIVTLNGSGLSYGLSIPVVTSSSVASDAPVLLRVSASIGVGYLYLNRVLNSYPISYNIRELISDTVEFNINYRDLPPSDSTFSSRYYSGYNNVESSYSEVGFVKGALVYTVENLDVDYHYASGVDLTIRNLRKTFSVSYFDRIKLTTPVSFDIRQRLQASNAVSYRSNVRLVTSTKLSYTSVSRVVKSIPTSYEIVATVYRLISSVNASYAVKAQRLLKSKVISFNNYAGIAKVFNTSYDINAARLTKTAPVSFTNFVVVSKSVGVSYDLRINRLSKVVPVSFTSAVRLTSPLPISYSLGISKVRKSTSISYNSFEPVKGFASVSYNVRQSLISLASVSYAKRVNIAKTTSVSYNSPIRLVTPFATGYGIRDYDRIQKTAPITYFSVKEITTVINTPNNTLTLPDGTKIPSGNTIYQSQNIDVIEVEPLLVIGGEIIYVLDMSVAVDEGNYTYSCDATLANYTDLIKFESNKPFYVVLQGETYSFVVDSRTLNREEVNAPQAKIRGLSPTSHFTSPRSKQIIGTTFSESYTAKQIADHLLYDSSINYTIGDSGGDLTQAQANAISLDWEIQDWGIPPYRYGAENTYPLDALKTIVEAVGGVVEATPEGNIRARYKFPVKVPDYSDATTDHFFYDADDIISIQENHAPNRMVNAVYVKTYQDMGIQDTIEYFDQLSAPDPWGTVDTFGGGIVRVFPAIWRDTVDLSHNRNDDPDVYLEYQGIEEWTPNEWVNPEYGWETIDIVKGQGSTKYPITKVLGYGYMSDNAGEIIINDYSRTFYTKSEQVRFSIVKLKYQTRCHRWKLVAKGGTHIQFKIADTVFNTYLR